MKPKQFWLWVDGRKRYYDYPPDPPGHTLEQLEEADWREQLAKRAGASK